MEKTNRLLSVPSLWLLVLTWLIGKPGTGQRLCSSLQVDISHTKACLVWLPPYKLGDALKTIVQKALSFMHSPLIRCIDFLLAFLGLLLTWPVLLLICVIGLFDTGSPIFRQQRVGKDRKPFTLFKFRTMPKATASVATHLVDASSVTKLGAFLRKTKLDELLQLINVLKGEMSFVGPRPCLFNQTELIGEREKRGVTDVLPGITGLAQINGVDMSTPEKLAELDQEMIRTFTLSAYFAYILQTAMGKGVGDRLKRENV